MLIHIHPDNPQPRNIQQVVDCLKKGGVIIYPTDSVYAFACDINYKNAVEKICNLRGIDVKKANFSIVCNEFSSLTHYAKQISTPIFRVLKQCLPGPYTFIFNASQQVPKIFRTKKQTIGIRIPDNLIATKIVELLGNPIMTASLKNDDEIIEYLTDPELIYEKYGNVVDIVINGGYGNNEPTTIIDCTGDEPILIREGIGDISFLN